MSLNHLVQITKKCVYKQNPLFFAQLKWNSLIQAHVTQKMKRVTYMGQRSTVLTSKSLQFKNQIDAIPIYNPKAQ